MEVFGFLLTHDTLLMKKILLADDHAIVRSGIKSIIEDNLGPVEIDEAGTESTIISSLKRKTYDLIILDIGIPNADFSHLITWIGVNSPNTRILIFSMHPDEIYGIRCLQLGAKGYVRKTESNEEIITAIRKILNGEKYISRLLSEILSIPAGREKLNNPFNSLSLREMEIVKHLNEGLSLPEICEVLNIQYSTANTFKRRIFEKLGVDSVLSLTRLMKTFEM